MKIDVLDKGFIELLESMGNDSSIAESARISHLGKYKSDEADAKLIRNLITSGHTSPLEQVEFRFLVKAPIYVARQWMRHRTWSYNEISRRYTSKDMDFYIPKFDNDDVAYIYEQSVLTSLACYNTLIEMDVKKEQARGVLPTSLYTTFYAKTDLHNLLHFLELRLNKGAQYEIVEYANAICKLIEPIVPVTLQLWKDML